MKSTGIRSVCVAVVTLLAIAMAASAAAAKTVKNTARLTITITDKAITIAPKSPKGDTNYTVVVTNKSSKARGLKMSGKDKAGSPYARYTKMLAKGESQTITFYFPSKRTLTVREMLSYEPSDGPEVKATFGKMTAKVIFR